MVLTKIEAQQHTRTVTHSNPSPTSAPSTVTVKEVTSTECTKRHTAQEHLHQLAHTHTHECAFCCLIRDSLRRDIMVFFFFGPFLRFCLQMQK